MKNMKRLWMMRVIVILFTLHSSLFNVQWSMFNGQWSMFNGQWSMVRAQKLVVTQDNVMAGRTGFCQPITATFELRNKSLRKLVIESVKPDCGCTAVEYPKEVGANDKFTIKMTYDARQLGHFQKMAAIVSNGSKQPVYLTMRGIVLPEMVDGPNNRFISP